MLDLVRKNAPQHMDNPEFQKDMLESMDDALKRMAKVQARLSVFKGKMVPDIRAVELGLRLQSHIEMFARKLPGLDISLKCPQSFTTQTDPDFIFQIMENLLLNAWEAGGDGTVVRIEVAVDSVIRIDLRDNGPGIRADLLPSALFEPFRTGKPSGSGIGLWQVRQLVESLGGDIQARNGAAGGGFFSILLPYQPDTGQLQNTRAAASK
jgi:signal transduction histidine kinase